MIARQRECPVESAGMKHRLPPSVEMPSLICFNLKCCAVFLHAGHALTHLHWIKRCSEHNNSNITDNNGNDNAHSQRQRHQQQEQEELVQHPSRSRSRSRSSPCCCIVKWKSTDIVAEKFPFVHSGKAEAGKWSELLLWSERKTATGSGKKQLTTMATMHLRQACYHIMYITRGTYYAFVCGASQRADMLIELQQLKQFRIPLIYLNYLRAQDLHNTRL